MGLRAFIVKRSIYTFVLIVAVITVNFIIFDLMPGNPLETFASPQRLKNPAQLEALIRRFDLDKGPVERYLRYLRNLLTGEFGVSYYTGEPVAGEIGERLGNTLLLMGLTTVFAIIIGVVLGVLAAYKRGGKTDSVTVFGALTTYSLPSFWMGMLFLLIFSYHLGWFPLRGATPGEWGDPLVWPNPPQWPQDWALIVTARLRHLFLPVLTLVLFSYGGYLLLTRAVMLESLTEDYIITARAKGLKERTVLFKHALKNASLPLITNIALSFGFLISGAIITEQVFTYKGMGWWIWNAVVFKDFPSLNAIFFLMAVCVILANFISDVLYGIVDPRIKYG